MYGHGLKNLLLDASTAAFLLCLLLAFSGLVYPQSITGSPVHTNGQISYDGDPTDFSVKGLTRKWATTLRVDDGFADYYDAASGAFDWTGYFTGLRSRFIDPLYSLGWEGNYAQNMPAWSWAGPSYSYGSGLRDLRNKADRIVWQNSLGFVFYNDTKGHVFGGNDRYANDEINNAINSIPDTDTTKIVFIENATDPYWIKDSIVISKSNLILAGAGWGVHIELDPNPIWSRETRLVRGSKSTFIIRDLSLDGNLGNAGTNSTTIMGIDVPNTFNQSIININMTRVRGHGYVPWGSSNCYFFNSWMNLMGWNMFSFDGDAGKSAPSNIAIIGNYLQNYSDVGISTFGSQYTAILNNLIGPPLGKWGINNAGWSIAIEGGTNFNSHHIYIRNNYLYNNTGGYSNQGGRGTAIFFDGNSDVWKVIVHDNKIRFCNRGIVLEAQSYTPGNIYFYNNSIQDLLSIDGRRPAFIVNNRNEGVWLTQSHSSSVNGYVNQEIPTESGGPHSYAYYDIFVSSQSSTNLTLRINGGYPSATAHVKMVVFHTGITTSWRIDFHNGTVVNALNYYDSTTHLLTYYVSSFISNSAVQSIYSKS